MANRARQQNNLNHVTQREFNKSRSKAKDGAFWAPLPKGWKKLIRKKILNNKVKGETNND